VINACSELLRRAFESQWDEDRSRRTKGARVSVLLDGSEKLFLWRDNAHRAKARRQNSMWQSILPRRRQPIFPTIHLQLDASPEPLQIPTALIPRELPAVDGEHMGYMKKPAMNNIKRFSHHREKDEIRQNTEARFWNGAISEFARGVAIKALELISERIRHLRRKKKTGVPGFIGD
jgi:hypothetical protein